ncbi:hypothetical protein NW762_007835 [Fusarium torreyae]|uniref:HNH nuclease domain-containing protein n=1 Tax=Fusarium torreyae TaxID=1237075 RepID=A0A9W8VDR0_9HYPO|nr:hypothetical protein NW762_007835 [Fusarium torreyae]
MARLAHYLEEHETLNGPGDARPTATQIIKDQDFVGKWSGRIVLVTGCFPGGIGPEAARAFHVAGADVFITVRDINKDILADWKPGKIEVIQMDLASIDSVIAGAEEFLSKSKSKRLNVLVKNAGLMACPQGQTKDKREYAKEIEANIRAEYQPEFRLRTEHVASILTVPLSMLQPGGRLSGRSFIVEGRKLRGTTGFMLYDRLEVIWSFVKYFLKKRTKVVYAASEASKSQPGAHDDGSSANNKKTRIRNPGQAERRKCLSRDRNACRVTTAAYGEVCHIVPFRFNNNTANAERTASLFSATDILCGRNFCGTYFLLLTNPAVLGSLDQVWNLICLHPQLHTWWREGYLAFKCLGVEPAESGDREDEAKVTLQFLWMSRLTRQFGQEMRLTGQDNDYMRLIQEIQEI